MQKVKILVIVLSLMLIGCTKGKINIDKINGNIIEGYEVAKVSVDQIKIITDGLCETGLVEASECLKLEGIYLAIDTLTPILDKLTLMIFHGQDNKNQAQNIANYIIELSKFNQQYYELIQLLNKYKKEGVIK